MRRDMDRITLLSITMIFLLSINLTLPIPSFADDTSPASPPASISLTTIAWNYFNQQDYSNAYSTAEKEISQAGKAATGEEINLESSPKRHPPIGHVSKTQKDQVNQNVELNDVSTAYFIVAYSEYNLYSQTKGADPQSAQLSVYRNQFKLAYDACRLLKYGRCWDPSQSLYWSPAQACHDKFDLAKMGL